MDASGVSSRETYSPGAPYSPSSPKRDGGRDAGSPRDDAGFDANNFAVVIRVRPPLPREQPFTPAVLVRDERTITISENLSALDDAGGAMTYSTHTLNFDYVYDENSTQRVVYETTAKAVVDSSLKGYNATIFAYGQTGTGKTYTMEGFNSADERGIIPRSIEQIFRHIHTSVSPRVRFLVRASYLQIYNEVISDLLRPERTNLLIREDKKRGVFVEDLSEWVVRSPAEIYGLMERGGARRATGSTRMNELSSRSHAVFIIIAEQSETTYLDDSGAEMSVEDFHRLVKSRAHGDAALKALEANVKQSFKVGKLNLVDLAGSERVRLTGATGQRLEESKKINQSLSALGNVIAALTDARGRQHIPYRDSKLTRILEDSLGGNCKTTMMAMISPALEAFVESLSTLKFANRAKSIKNEARINEDLDQKSLLRRYERELKKLRSELDERSKSVVDNRKLLELDEQRRRAEEDKMAAIRALETRSREFMREKQEKKALEERITMLQAKILMGGASGLNIGNLQEIPAFRNALKEHQERIKQEYEGRLQDLEKERETIEEEKAQVDRYKQLLLKQRDIMILLTQRLNERDEQIMALQDELDAYDRHQHDLEEKLDEKTAALIHLQRVTMEQDAVSPVRNSQIAKALGAWASPGSSVSATARGGAGSVATMLAFNGEMTRGARGAVSGGVVPSQLLSTRQFKRFEDERSNASPNEYSGVELLSAEEKIDELSRIVEKTRGDREGLVRDLEDVQAEKVQMESLLRDRLEKLVQEEIENRLAVMKGKGGPEDSRSLMLELARREAELSNARSDVASLRNEMNRKSSADSASELVQQRLTVLEKERGAIAAIMEGKIAKLVDQISAGVQSSVPEALLASQPKWLRELSALDRLVKASVRALSTTEGRGGVAGF